MAQSSAPSFSSRRCTLSQEDQGTSWKGPAHCSCSTGENERLVFSPAYRLAMAVLSLQRSLSTGISTLKDIITLKKGRLFTILFWMSLAALAGAYCGISLLMWMLRAKNVPQVLLGQPAANLRSLRNTLALWGEQSQQMQQLRDEVARLAAEIGTMKKEVQQMREAVSATTQMSDWALKSAGAAIDLHRSSSSSAWLCRVFWFLCAPHVLDTFVQPDASPGYCWPFQGSRSEVLIRLPAQVRPTAVTIQHTSKIASPLGTVSSAPRDFTVSGLDEEGEDETLLGTFTYAVHKEPTQTFPLQNGNPRAFRFLKLGIQSNWGKPGYTCIYRVQVHGKIVGSSAIGQTRVETLPH
ncbi:sperm-associated antigen 4 protein-like [Gavia stellata]|uniref:sperm-associated antigen 4 protein-like n=1 Tax=Gavia stellata TaxID=37040 RepID=UPI00289BC3E9|nr:sperm-associated antigen 4 protein-like [Gavia stellata]XP_059689532.1 sperm-associated antigen 4 protein-like [Gavia stellata]XP_059689540.1 sperm-associated antigen 4 protein-like [Gavia stellata]